jgi:hypothetical protein
MFLWQWSLCHWHSLSRSLLVCSHFLETRSPSLIYVHDTTTDTTYLFTSSPQMWQMLGPTLVWGTYNLPITANKVKKNSVTWVCEWTILWSCGQIKFLALPAFLRSSGSGTGSIPPGEYNWGATWWKT